LLRMAYESYVLLQTFDPSTSPLHLHNVVQGVREDLRSDIMFRCICKKVKEGEGGGARCKGSERNEPHNVVIYNTLTLPTRHFFPRPALRFAHRRRGG